ncbi:hypothetical protein A3H80_01155 [Candidatus Roizmanbacteria bacterium RIFCSPLOWO2_02_FULL_37_19]|uniref:Uncharacterized protein n=1 Tax=Candidatus Roizmanbacteria bacterium RIFCSPHIGHO2_02_FULL_37_24 TaxID=1802037 RepID=A0A1F7GUR3_9BACT|nr:MAG: hypothetical protein A2862_00640 [Candidatus Roizmanbacteria bacterium RIFCSPHIGHO2_01_FULL_38_41]OGK22545.1 MAG: hypothetical protein A3C24_05275 [Candidatus Roizmanbacteria bacterium RIFCSPHIGHO2_02_FULL_37_24]OGK33945.1 MAG: hypothetical protein A3E10_02060 [Candidatus Roizmanbacteria bacterium RIFCSPHIGHO2_12_FULL_37_23]OGK43637.1 MAG: hypothetical protein A2956_04005 [Candidatus Roizmanbacteria bacterium RIFCSPLOWO2_01_FULL_37_57]OGK54208.1 MAG: hypothetical protein A3H80_01155 [Ca
MEEAPAGISIQSPEREFTQHPYTIFVQGLAHGPEMAGSLKQIYSHEFGQDLHLWSSDLSTTREQQQENERLQIDELKTHLKDGPLRVIAHSIGTSRFDRRMSQALVEDPELANYLSNLDLILVSPVGFLQGPTRDVALIHRFWKGVFKTLTMPHVREIPSFERGIDSLALVPIGERLPADEPLEQRPTFAERLRQVFPDISQQDDTIRLAGFDPTIDYRGALNPRDSDRLHIIDEELKKIEIVFELDLLSQGDQIAIDTLRNKRRDIKRLVSDRGKLLAPYLDSAFAGKFAETEPPQTNEDGEVQSGLSQRARQLGQALLGVASMAKDIHDMKPLQRVRELQEKGARIRFFVPEYDGFFNVQDIPHDLASDVTVLELTMHASWYFRPESLVTALKMAEASNTEGYNTEG